MAVQIKDKSVIKAELGMAYLLTFSLIIKLSITAGSSDSFLGSQFFYKHHPNNANNRKWGNSHTFDL